MKFSCIILSFPQIIETYQCEVALMNILPNGNMYAETVNREELNILITEYSMFKSFRLDHQISQNGRK